MIDFASQNNFVLENFTSKITWVTEVAAQEKMRLGQVSYVFCDDAFLHSLNLQHLNHDTLTDVISFDYTQRDVIEGEIYISTERVAENALELGVSFEEELDRVMIHGLLHFCGYKDKSKEEKREMRAKEDHYLLMRDSNL